MANFSKRHYEQIAGIIAALRENDNGPKPESTFGQGMREGAKNRMEVMQGALVRIFARDNPRFDAERFNKACGPRGDKQ